jgi:hypothetical protein
MHLHLVQFQVLDRQPFTISNDKVVLAGTPTPPALEEAGWKDTVLAPPFQVTRIITRFEDYEGRYPYHCHMLEHEDHAMMRQFQTLPPCGDGGCPEFAVGGSPRQPSGCACGLAASDRAHDRAEGFAALAIGLALLLVRRRRRSLWSVFAFLLVAGAMSGCSSDAVRPPVDAGGAGGADAQAGLPFGAACASDPSCQSNRCATFGDGSQHCTIGCARDEDCPAGSQGSKCNGKGFCAY